MIYLNGKRKIELEETIQINNLPNEFTGEYVHIHMTNVMQNLFAETEHGTTLWTANLHYTELNGVMIKLMVKLFPGMFKKQTQKWLNQFKAFAEKAK